MAKLMMSLNIKLKRVYEPVEASDGMRILVERLWPRGISKEKGHIDHWMKEVAPSTALRKWYGHEPERWPDFQKKYEAELKENPEAISELLELCKKKPVTFVYSAHDELRNSAIVLKHFLEHHPKAGHS